MQRARRLRTLVAQAERLPHCKLHPASARPADPVLAPWGQKQCSALTHRAALLGAADSRAVLKTLFENNTRFFTHWRADALCRLSAENGAEIRYLGGSMYALHRAAYLGSAAGIQN